MRAFDLFVGTLAVLGLERSLRAEAPAAPPPPPTGATAPESVEYDGPIGDLLGEQVVAAMDLWVVEPGGSKEAKRLRSEARRLSKENRRAEVDPMLLRAKERARADGDLVGLGLLEVVLVVRGVEGPEASALTREASSALGLEPEVLLAHLEETYGFLAQERGEFAEALGAFARARPTYASRKMDRYLAELDEDVGVVLSSLGRDEEALRAFERARPEYLARGMVSRVAGLDKSLGATLVGLDRREEALQAFERARPVFEAQGLELDAADIDMNIGILLADAGRHREALEAFERARALFVKRGREEPMAVIDSLRAVAMQRMDRHEDALPLLREALATFDRIRLAPPLHVAMTLQALARTLEALGRPADALPYAKRAADLFSDSLDKLAAVSSDADRLRFLDMNGDLVSDYLDRLLRQAAAENTSARAAEALSEVERFNGTLFAGAVSLKQRAAQSRDIRVVSALREVTRLQDDIAEIEQLRAQAQGEEAKGLDRAYEAKMEETRRLAGLIYRALGKPVPETFAGKKARRGPAPWNAAAICRSLPPGALLVETAWTGPRYHALALSQKGCRAIAYGIGTTRDVDALVADVRGSWDDARGFEVKARRLGDAVFGKARERGLFEGAKHLFVVADGKLSMAPLDAVSVGDDRPLLSRMPVSYLTEGRDLERVQRPFVPGTRAVVVGGPDFGHAGTAAGALADAAVRGGPEAAVACVPRETSWPALDGAREEAEAVARALSGQGAVAVTGSDATETLVRDGLNPQTRYIHFATHGYFWAECREAGETSPAKSRGLGPLANLEGAAMAQRAPDRRARIDPLSRSGLVFAGATAGGDGRNNGYLTAMEAVGLELRGTELAVLSACDTGSGEPKPGQGVFGLRRAFLEAGARTVVTSLAKVPDEDTRALMERFYDALLVKKLPKSDALRRVRLEMKDRGAPPRSWALWTLYGDWR